MGFPLSSKYSVLEVDGESKSLSACSGVPILTTVRNIPLRRLGRAGALHARISTMIILLKPVCS